MKNDISNRVDIQVLIDAFYEDVQKDELLGFIFKDVAKVNWKTHLPVMYDFWENILFHTGRYDGNPLQTHLHLNKMTRLTSLQFDRWLKIFVNNVDAIFEGQNAEAIKMKAKSIATVMQIKLKIHE